MIGAEVRAQVLLGHAPGAMDQHLVDGDAEPALAQRRPGGLQIIGAVPAQCVQLAGGLRPGAGVKVAGQQAATVVAEDAGTTNVTFSNANPWPAGKYKVDVTVNGQPAGMTQEIEVK